MDSSRLQTTKTEKSDISSSSATSRSSTRKNWVFQLLPDEKIAQFLANLTPDDSLFNKALGALYYVVCTIFFFISALPDTDYTGKISTITHLIFMELPFNLGFKSFLQSESLQLLAFQILFGVLLALQIVLLILMLLGLDNMKLLKSEMYKRVVKILLFICYCASPSIFNVFTEFASCNFMNVYSSTAQNLSNMTFQSSTCTNASILPFIIIGIPMVMFQLAIFFISSFVIIPINQTSHLGAIYNQYSVSKVMLLTAFQFLIVGFLPKGLAIIGYGTSCLAMLLSYAIFILDHPFHSWFQSGFIMSIFVVRGAWSFLLLLYEIIYILILSPLNPFPDVRTFLKNFADIIGVVVFFGTFLVSALVGGLTFLATALIVLRIGAKFKFLMRTKRIEDQQENGKKEKIYGVDGNDNNDEADAKLVPVSKRRRLGILDCWFFHFLSSKVSNDEFTQGMQYCSFIKKIDPIVFEELVHERVFDDMKRDNSSMIFSIIIFLLTRKKMEKMKRIEPQPSLSELMMLLFKKLEGRQNGFVSTLRMMTIRNYLFSLHEKNSVDYEIKNILMRVQRLEGQFWAQNESFWKQVLDGSQQGNKKKAKNNLLLISKKIKRRKKQIKALYDYLLSSFPKDPNTLRLYAKYLHNIEKNPEATYYMQKAHDIEEQKIRQKRKKLFQNGNQVVPMNQKLDRSNTMSDSHDPTTISDSELNSEVSSTTSNDDQDKGRQEKARISAAILRKKTEFVPKCINCLLFALIFSAPLVYIVFCFYTLTSNASVVQENSMRTYKTCRLPGDIYYCLISMRKFEQGNMTAAMKTKLFSVFDRTMSDLEDAFTTTRDVGNQKQVWEQQLIMQFITNFPILNFTNWETSVIQTRESYVSLSSMSNALVNFLKDFEVSDISVEDQRKKNLVPYLDEFNCFLDRNFCGIYENAYAASYAFDDLCTAVFISDISKSSTYEYLLIAMFVALLLIPIPITLVFAVVWYLLLSKQKAITSLYFYLPNEVSGGVYQDIKKKRSHETSKEFATNYEPKLILCYILVMVFFFAVVIIAFIITLICVLQSLATLYSIKDASGTTFHMLEARFLVGEFVKKYSGTYPITTKMTDEEYVTKWTSGKKKFYTNWNNLRFGDGYTGLESLGADAKLAASTVSRMIVTAETIQHLVDSAKASNKSMDYVRDNVLEMFSLIEDAHYTILDEVLRYLPYLMAQSSATYTALLLFLVLASAPFLFGVSVFLLCVVFEYEDDNYELLQQFNRVPPETVINISAIKSYVFESSLSEVNQLSIFRCFRCCSLFSKKKVKGEVVGTKIFEDIYQTCPTPVIVCAQNGNVSFINTPAINVFEFDGPTDVVGVNVNRLFSTNSRTVLTSFFKNLQKNTDQLGRRKTILVKEERLIGKRKNGQEFPCILSVALNQIQNQLMVPLFVTDVTSDEQHEKLIQAEKAKSEQLLLNILPAAVAKRLGDGEQLICESFPDVTCFFSDIVGFTNLSSKITAWELIKLLNDIVNGFDDVADKLSVEKIKTIGDAYFAVSGLHFNKNDHPQKMMLFAIRARALLDKINSKALPASIRNQNSNPIVSGDPKYANTNLSASGIQIRIGIHTGGVVGGVIGKSKFQYDVWGSTVNMASRMESTGMAGKIQVSRSTYERLHEIYKFEQRDGVKVKGIGDVSTYVLDDSKIPQDAFDSSMTYEFEMERPKGGDTNGDDGNFNENEGDDILNHGASETNLLSRLNFKRNKTGENEEAGEGGSENNEEEPSSSTPNFKDD